MPQTSKAIIFDMDGVLIDSQPLHYQVDMLALRQAGMEADLPLVEKYAGMSNPDRWVKYKKDLNLKQRVSTLIDSHVIILNDFFMQENLEAIPYVKDVLVMLQNEKIKMAVASSSSRAFIEMILKKIGIIHFFEEIVSGEEVEKGKPAPDVFLQTAAKLQVPPVNCMVVEDSTNGVLAAKAAGMYCIGYINTNSGLQDVTRADDVIASFDHFMDAYKKGG